jgi:hypothetical protein
MKKVNPYTLYLSGVLSESQYLEFLDPKGTGVGDAADVATKAGLDVAADVAAGAIDTAAVAAGYIPAATVVKAILSASASKVKEWIKNWERSGALKAARQMVRQKIEQDIRSGNAGNKALRPGHTEAEIRLYTDATPDSKACLSVEENQSIMNAVIQAVKNNTIVPGFAQDLVNELLKEKINKMQEALQKSPVPKVAISR